MSSRSVRPRALLSSGLAILGAVLLVTGASAFWVRTQVLGAEGFARNAERALATPPAIHLLSTRIVDQVIERGSAELITIRPLLESVVTGILSTGAFRDLYAAAVADAHRTLLAHDKDTIVLGLSDVMIVVTTVLEKTLPQVAARLPANLQSMFIKVSERNYGTRLVGLARDLRFVALMLPGLALAVLGMAWWIAAPRRRAFAVFGIAVAVAAVATMLGAAIVESLVVRRVSDPLEAAALRAALDAFDASLRVWMWRLGTAGVLFAGVVGSTLTLADARAALAWAWRVVAEGATTPGGRLLHATVLVGGGMTLLTWPEVTVRLTARVLGLVALYYGIGEAGRLVRQGDAAVVFRLGRFRRFRIRTRSVVVSAAVAATAGGLLVWWGDREVEPARIAPVGVMRCNGHAALCERRLPEMAFASAHNAMSAASEPGWYFASHDRGIPEQLAAGVRGFLIDSHYGVMGQGGRVRTEFAEGVNRHKLEEELGEPFVAAAKRITARWTPAGDNATRRPYLCHGFCEVGATDLVDALGAFRMFLERNPHEVIVIFFEDYITPDDTAAAFEESGLIRHVYTHEPGAAWPTLREMIEADTRVLALSEKFGNAPRPAWYHAGFDVVQETPFRYHAPEEFSCRPNRGTPESPLLMMNHWIEKVTPSPADAEAVNARDVLLPRARQCERERGMLPSLVAVNFYARGDVFAVVDALNGLEP